MTLAGQYTEHFITLNGLAFRYLEWPQPDAPVLLLLPGVGGLGGAARQWEPFAVAMQDRYRVLAMEQRGHGYSARTTVYTWDRVVADIDAFIETVIGAPVDLVGHSAGGAWAYLYAGLHPARVRRLVVVDMGLVPEVWAVQAARRATAPPPWTSLDKAVAHVQTATGVHASLTGWFPRLMADAVEEAAPGAWRWRQDVAIWPGIREFLSPSRDEALRILRAIRSPSLVVWGANSAFMTYADAEEVTGAIAGGQLATVVDSGHVVHLEQPAAFVAAVRPFLLSETD